MIEVTDNIPLLGISIIPVVQIIKYIIDRHRHDPEEPGIEWDPVYSGLGATTLDEYERLYGSNN